MVCPSVCTLVEPAYHTCTAGLERKLTVEREFESQIYSASRSHSSECFESSIAQKGTVFSARYAIRESN